MTLCCTFIGSLDEVVWDESQWTSALWSSNIPHRASPLFPFPASAPNVGDRLYDMTQRGELDGKMVDWGAWVARVSKAEVLKFMDDVYGPHCADWYTHQAKWQHTKNMVLSMQELQAFVGSLADDVIYALVAMEG